MQLETTATHARSAMPEELLEVLRAAEQGLGSAPRASTVSGGLAQWAEVVAASQRVMNLAAAMQDEAIASLAAIEPEELEDGTVVETHRAAGHVALDAPAMLSGVLAVSALHAELRVRAAVRRVADGPSGTDTETGLGALHEAMRRGQLDAYRAGVVADEFELAPPEVAAAVVAALGERLVNDAAPQLRRRCRTLLSRVSPDLVRQRAKLARERCGLRRWAEEPGVDKWEGTFPSEDAARAWSAIDALAQQLVADGTCLRIDGARSRALIDLVTGSATITSIVTLTVPAGPEDPGCDPLARTDSVDPQGRRPTVPMSPSPAHSVEGTRERATSAPTSRSEQALGGSAAPSASPEDLVMGSPQDFVKGSPQDFVKGSPRDLLKGSPQDPIKGSPHTPVSRRCRLHISTT